MSQHVALSQTVGVGQTAPDYLGSLGPRSAYRPELARTQSLGTDFVSDIVCRPEIVEAGTVVAGSTTTTRTRRYYCVVTARSRTVLDVPTDVQAPAVHTWAVGAQTFEQNPFSAYHEMRMTLLTPEEVL